MNKVCSFPVNIGSIKWFLWFVLEWKLLKYEQMPSSIRLNWFRYPKYNNQAIYSVVWRKKKFNMRAHATAFIYHIILGKLSVIAISHVLRPHAMAKATWKMLQIHLPWLFQIYIQCTAISMKSAHFVCKVTFNQCKNVGFRFDSIVCLRCRISLSFALNLEFWRKLARPSRWNPKTHVNEHFHDIVATCEWMCVVLSLHFRIIFH